MNILSIRFYLMLFLANLGILFYFNIVAINKNSRFFYGFLKKWFEPILSNKN